VTQKFYRANTAKKHSKNFLLPLHANLSLWKTRDDDESKTYFCGDASPVLSYAGKFFACGSSFRLGGRGYGFVGIFDALSERFRIVRDQFCFYTFGRRTFLGFFHPCDARRDHGLF